MNYDQRVIIRFLWNEGVDINQITAKLQAQFGEHVYKLQMVQFWIDEVQFGRQDLHDEICTAGPPLDDLDLKILAILDKPLFKSDCSISEKLYVGCAIVLEYLHVSIDFKSFHLRWVPYLLTNNLRQNGRSMQALCCHSCMLPNVMAGIIL
jgi:hypothetical protein